MATKRRKIKTGGKPVKNSDIKNTKGRIRLKRTTRGAPWSGDLSGTGTTGEAGMSESWNAKLRVTIDESVTGAGGIAARPSRRVEEEDTPAADDMAKLNEIVARYVRMFHFDEDGITDAKKAIERAVIEAYYLGRQDQLRAGTTGFAK